MEEYKIWQLIYNNEHFLLSGGAGSGKTYTLVQVLRQITNAYPNAPIACITYTNAAVKEIKSRIDNTNLRVSTIHDFMWSCICNHQTELRSTLAELITDGTIKADFTMTENVYADKEIKYKEYVRLSEGIISHDQVLVIAERMYATYPKLGKILMDSYPFIMVDEYQDTSKMVVDILLRHLKKQESGNHFVVGFFGDAMQSIYDGSVGNLDMYLKECLVKEVQKTENRRNPQSIINLANQLRTDNLKQKPSIDANATNINKKNGQVKQGCAMFIYSKKTDIDKIRDYLINNRSWQEGKIKELHLTKNLIANKAGFPTLHKIYKGNDVYSYIQIIKKYFKEQHVVIEDDRKFSSVFAEYEDKLPSKVDLSPIEDMSWSALKDMYVNVDMLMDNKTMEEDEESPTGTKLSNIVEYILKIAQLIDLYNTNNVAEFLKKTEYRITTYLDKRKLSECMGALTAYDSDAKIGGAISKCEELNLIKRSDSFEREIETNRYIYNLVCDVSFNELVKLYEYKECHPTWCKRGGI